jgi:hypothetical protein
MNRRDLLTSVVASGLAVPAFATQGHGGMTMNGPLANATVSFGFWPPMSNRFTTPNAPAAPNGHHLLPHEATVKAGGSVNFIVAGFHLIAVYAPGKSPADVDVASLVAGSVPPGLIDDPAGRVYFGADPRTLPQDRVEVVQFGDPGRYLVICAVRPHFVNDQMYGWVKVLP